MARLWVARANASVRSATLPSEVSIPSTISVAPCRRKDVSLRSSIAGRSVPAIWIARCRSGVAEYSGKGMSWASMFTRIRVASRRPEQMILSMSRHCDEAGEAVGGAAEHHRVRTLGLGGEEFLRGVGRDDVGEPDVAAAGGGGAFLDVFGEAAALGGLDAARFESVQRNMRHARALRGGPWPAHPRTCRPRGEAACALRPGEAMCARNMLLAEGMPLPHGSAVNPVRNYRVDGHRSLSCRLSRLATALPPDTERERVRRQFYWSLPIPESLSLS